MLSRFDFSTRSWARVVLVTVLSTLGCICIAIVLDSFSFGSEPVSARVRSVINDIVITLVLAGPLIFIFSSKLRELAIAHHKLAIFASTDSLTLVLNRGAFTSRVHALLAGEGQEPSGGALLVIDVDYFKRINDSFGHDRGDDALRIVAAKIKGVLRSVDLVGRIGGEEFGVFLPGASPENAEIAAERIRQAINLAEFLPDGRHRPLSVSVGGAIFVEPVAFKQLFREADRRLYEAKNLGRNRIAVGMLGDETSIAA